MCHAYNLFLIVLFTWSAGLTDQVWNSLFLQNAIIITNFIPLKTSKRTRKKKWIFKDLVHFGWILNCPVESHRPLIINNRVNRKYPLIIVPLVGTLFMRRFFCTEHCNTLPLLLNQFCLSIHLAICLYNLYLVTLYYS